MKAIMPLILFVIGGLLYLLIELVFRGHTHWTMFFVGGLCFVLVGAINEVISWETPLVIQCIIGGVIITAVEFVSGCIINLWLGWAVWDYRDMPFNLLGQICLPFSLLWVLISAVAIVVDDYVRYYLFGEERPRYKLI